MNINHIGINCRDIGEISAFFARCFEAKEGARYHNPRTGLHSLMLELPDGGARLELMNWPDMERHQQSAHMQGLVHLSMSVGQAPEGIALCCRQHTPYAEKLHN